MFIDATKEWANDMQPKEFVQLLREKIPELALTVLGDAGTGKGVDYYGLANESGKLEIFLDKLPLADFQQHLRSSWFFATGIQSSYELSLSDAVVAGAVLVDVGVVSHIALR